MYFDCYTAVLKHRELAADKFFEKINEFKPGLFEPLLEEFEPEEAKSIALYIVIGYSINSTYVLLREDWSRHKTQIVETAKVPEYLHSKCKNLESISIKNVIYEYLEAQCHSDFKHLKMLEDVYEYEMKEMFNSLGDSEKSSVKERRLTMKELREEIRDLKAQLQEDYKVYYDNIDLVKDISKKETKATLNVASSPHIE